MDGCEQIYWRKSLTYILIKWQPRNCTNSLKFAQIIKIWRFIGKRNKDHMI